MLTADLVRARQKGGELVVRRLSLPERERAAELARAYLALAEPRMSRDELVEAWTAVPITGREKRLSGGLQKLILDSVEFAAESPIDPVVLRNDLFLDASAARREAAPARFDRDGVIAKIAGRHGLSAEAADRALYADLKGEELLVAAPTVSAESIVTGYDEGQAQAVLLRAVKVVADVECRSPDAYRALFRALKFRRLLHRITPRDGGGYRIEIDGPYSLFDSVTKYGLGLALVLPALEACDALTLVAEVRWGKERKPLVFRHTGGGAPSPGESTPRLRDDIGELVEAWALAELPWRVLPCQELLSLPGVGVCAPDLVFEHAESGARVYFEALGFWSRDAVWKRVELVQSGLPAPILFAVSSRLRVSEAVLEETESGALYVYKGTMSPRAIARKLGELTEREGRPRLRAR